MSGRVVMIIINIVLALVLVLGDLGILFFDGVWIRSISFAVMFVATLIFFAGHYIGFEWDAFRARPVDHMAEPALDTTKSLINFGPGAVIFDDAGNPIQGTENCLSYSRPRTYEGPRKCGKVAAALHYHLCMDEDHGYSRGEQRWGVPGEYCGVIVDGIEYSVNKGDRDSSSSVIECWRRAIAGTEYDGVLDTATYTGNMKHVFLRSGLFDWMPLDGTKVMPGDIFLNKDYHAAMCQGAEVNTGVGVVSEFIINELGTLDGGVMGDQTRKESRVRDYYDFPWDGVLVYNGKADGPFDEDEVDDGVVVAGAAAIDSAEDDPEEVEVGVAD